MSDHSPFYSFGNSNTMTMPLNQQKGLVHEKKESRPKVTVKE